MRIMTFSDKDPESRCADCGHSRLVHTMSFNACAAGTGDVVCTCLQFKESQAAPGPIDPPVDLRAKPAHRWTLSPERMAELAADPFRLRPYAKGGFISGPIPAAKITNSEGITVGNIFLTKGGDGAPLRPGDRVILHDWSKVFVVRDVGVDRFTADDGQSISTTSFATQWRRSVEIVERAPEPPPEVGSHFVTSEGAKYIFNGSHLVCWSSNLPATDAIGQKFPYPQAGIEPE